jgi:hypothetical protein
MGQSNSNDKGKNERNEAIGLYSLWYFIFIFILGLTLIFTLIYGLTRESDTVSNNMLTYVPYRITLSTCILLQLGVWTLCLYSKQAIEPDTAVWGFLTMGLATFSWVGLSTVLMGMVHITFVVIFMASFLISMLILCQLTWQEEAGNVLRLNIALAIFCDIAMVILFNNGQFYILEHIAFISYSISFVLFFIIHPPNQWGSLPVNHQLESEIGYESVEWDNEECFPAMMPHSYPMVYPLGCS